MGNPPEEKTKNGVISVFFLIRKGIIIYIVLSILVIIWTRFKDFPRSLTIADAIITGIIISFILIVSIIVKKIKLW